MKSRFGGVCWCFVWVVVDAEGLVESGDMWD